MTPLAKHRLIALLVFFGGIALLIGGMIAFDVWIVANWGVEATISVAMRNAPQIVVFAFGNLCGGVIYGLAFHFWWGGKAGDYRKD